MPLSIPEAIEVRKSIRNFKDTHILDADINEIFNWMANRTNQIGPFGTAFTIEISIQSMLAKKERLGTYGYIKNAQGYILGLSQPDRRSLFEYGYVFENLVLFLTSIGIGTCWLAGTFDRKQLINNTRDTQGKIIPAITPIGYPAKNKHLKERITRRAIKANQRKPAEQLFFYQDFSQPLGDRGKDYRQTLHFVRIAPSAKNRQPWRLVFSQDLSQVHFYLVPNQNAEGTSACDLRYLDIGIAYSHFKAGIDQAGIPGRLEIQSPQFPGSEGYEYITTWMRQ